ncbi:MAG: sugar diacid recognition domain-containing protein [Eubacteriales bacterium]|nr:sugar diacid recognition domain-containing protein [Eubacteriales bacterium]
MHISKNSATHIVEEISKLVKQNINLMDETGHIIASCDKSRIGNFHYGAYKIISECLDEYIIDEDDASKGIKKGINLPLELDGEIVGVIGMTGMYDEVISSIKLVKKMTEILLMESRVSYHQLMDKRVRNAFFEEWLINSGYKNTDELEDRGKSLGIDINRPRRVFIASIDELDNYKDSQEGQSKIAKFENDVAAFLNRNNCKTHFRNASRQIIIVDDKPTANIVEFAKELADYIWNKENVELNIGIDGGSSDDMHISYIQAHRAWSAAATEHEQITCYENMSLELLLSSVPMEVKLEYLKKIFGNSTNEELAEQISLLKAYFNAQGSIQTAADNLYIHKNTLQYRITKLKEQTGYDVRKPSECPALFLAYTIAEEIESENYDLNVLLHNTK